MPTSNALKKIGYLEQIKTEQKNKPEEKYDFGGRFSIDENSLGFLQDVVRGLESDSKTLPCKYFYDEQGSKLFEDICATKEYYITRTELALLPEVAKDLHAYFDQGLTIVEPGCGAGEKVKVLLRELGQVNAFVPLEISASALSYSVSSIKNHFPDVDVNPLLGDFTDPAHLCELSQSIDDVSERLVFFPGSTIGNFERDDAVSILKNLSVIAADKGYLLVGIDLIKDRRKLLDAYNDENGVTEAFNKNILQRANKELNADFDVESGFDHLAIYNETHGRIEMHLQSRCDQTVSIAGKEFSFSKNECVHTENSHKHSSESFTSLANAADLDTIKYWTDKDKYFGLFLLRKKIDNKKA